MSDKPFVENFWSKIEKDGSFNLTEANFMFLYMLDPYYADQTQTVEILKKRDYNGEQLTFNFEAKEVTPND